MGHRESTLIPDPRQSVNRQRNGRSPLSASGLQSRSRVRPSAACTEGRRVCILRRMARMQVYLPDDLYEQVKVRGLPASELLQEAVRAELRRLDLLTETDRYVADLVAEVGPPTPAQR